MAHVVVERCVDCRYTDCCAVCPVDCFYEVKDPAMLVIDPATCIDCALCVPECPIYAVYPENEVPDPYKGWIQKNADLFSKGEMVNTKVDQLPSAIPLEDIHAREKSKGWDVKDPSAVAEGAAGGDTGGAAAPAAAAPPPPPPPGVGGDSSGAARTVIPRFEERPSLKVRDGGRVRVGYRIGTVEIIRKTKTGTFVDVKILFDNEEKPCWYQYSSLQTLRDKGEFEVLDPGPMPSVFELLFGGELRY